jgi:CRP-like cAMP-binding protein
MKPFPFQEGDCLLHKGQTDCPWYVIERGVVRARDITVPVVEGGNNQTDSHHRMYADFDIKAGECFGERAIMTGTPSVANASATCDGLAFVVDGETFLQVLGDLEEAILRSVYQMQIRAIPVISVTTQCDERIMNFLANRTQDLKLTKGTTICQEGEALLREASLKIISSDETKNEILVANGYFGDDQLFADMVTPGTTFKPAYSATVEEDCTLGVLKLSSCRRVVDTRRMGEPQNVLLVDSLVVGKVKHIGMQDLKLYRILGAGTFGQTWLCSRVASDGRKRAYALKVQSKYELCQSGQAKGVVREKNIMEQFQNPFVASLVASFQDKHCIYMVMDLIQGGELYTVMHTESSDTMTEKDAKFYIACIAEGLSYM